MEVVVAPVLVAGAPMPVVPATNRDLLPRREAAPGGEEPVLLRLSTPIADCFGPPNDEAFQEHPLHRRGLKPLGIREIADPSWIRSLERMNSVHPRHRPGRFRTLRHFVFV